MVGHTNRNTGKTHFPKGRIPWNKGLKGFLGGEKHYKWKGGRGGWLNNWIKERDNHTCQNCDLHDPEVMEVDHIIPKSVDVLLANERTNLVTLCANCHLKKTNKERKNGVFKNLGSNQYKVKSAYSD